MLGGGTSREPPSPSYPLPPSLTWLQIDGIVVDYRNQMRAPRAVNLMFPLPYEDSNSIPDRAKVVRQGTVFDLRCAHPPDWDADPLHHRPLPISAAPSGPSRALR